MDATEVREKFDKTGENGPVEKWEREVTTPTVKRGGEGNQLQRRTSYSPEDNTMYAYVIGGADLIVKVAKVGSIGWSVSSFTMDGDIESIGRPYYDKESEAQRAAREKVEAAL